MTTTLSLIRRRTGIAEQRGSTLLVALVMLVLLTLTALSAMNASTNSVQVVGNAQFHEESNAAAQQAIERVISTRNFIIAPPAAETIDINSDGKADYTVKFEPVPVCISYEPVNPKIDKLPRVCNQGAESFVACYWTVWDITAQVTDINGTGAANTVHQGVRTVADVNDASAKCGVN
jgi:Tfp pilus assembly protein PilX